MKCTRTKLNSRKRTKQLCAYKMHAFQLNMKDIQNQIQRSMQTLVSCMAATGLKRKQQMFHQIAFISNNIPAKMFVRFKKLSMCGVWVEPMCS